MSKYNDLSPDPSKWSDERLMAELELVDWTDKELALVGLKPVLEECERRGI